MLVSGLELWSWRQQARADAIAAEIDPAEVDWILQEVAALDQLSLRLESFKTRSQIELQQPLSDLTQLWQRRIHERVPVQYLTGRAPWRHFSLVVGPGVLIPRPETEYLIDLAVAAAEKSGKGLASPVPLAAGNWLDLGTGSGAIALGLAQVFPNATIHAVDYSADAIAIAQQNATNYGLAERIQFYQGSWFEPLSALKGQVSGLVSNPPYIPRAMVPSLQPEVAHHEPTLALDGGMDGLDSIRLLVATAPAYLHSGGVWMVEMMAGQAEAVADLLAQQGSYTQIQIVADFAGIERFAIAYRR